jgi:hypothetical protein
MDQPINGLLRRTNNNADAAISQNERILPSMYQHGRAPIAKVSIKPNRRWRHIVPVKGKETDLRDE